MVPLPGTDRKDQAKKVRYTHDIMIDTIIERPSITQKELAAMFGYTQALVSRLMCSDVFQARLAERRGELVDPILQESVEERLKGLAHLSTAILEEKLEASRSAELALKTLDIATRGYGAKAANVNVQNNFVALIPQKASSAEAWMQAHSPGAPVSTTPQLSSSSTPAPEMTDLEGMVREVQGAPR